jgi:hypothetical protein
VSFILPLAQSGVATIGGPFFLVSPKNMENINILLFPKIGMVVKKM